MMSLGLREIRRGGKETDLGFEGESTTGDRVQFVLVDLLLTQCGRGDCKGNPSQLFPPILDRIRRGEVHAIA